MLRARANLNSTRQAALSARLARDAVAADMATLAQWPDLPSRKPETDLFATNKVAFAGEALPGGLRVIALFEIEAQRLLREAEALDDAARPRLDLDLSAGLSGGDDTFGESASLDQPNARAALVLRYPLGNRVARKRVEINRLQREQTLAELERTGVQLSATVRAIEVRLRQLARLMQLNAEQIDLAQQSTEEELEQYKQGRSPLTFVIQSQDAEAAAETLRVRTAATYQQLRLEHRALLDRLW